MDVINCIYLKVNSCDILLARSQSLTASASTPRLPSGSPWHNPSSQPYNPLSSQVFKYSLPKNDPGFLGWSLSHRGCPAPPGQGEGPACAGADPLWAAITLETAAA